MRLFLGPHRARFAFDWIEQPRLLIDGAASFDDVDLSAHLEIDRLADKADRIEVLDLAARAERATWLAHRNVDVGAQVALLHVAIAGAEITQDRAQFAQEG